MSKYFTYRSRDDLERDIGSRGVEIELAAGVDALLEPVTIDGR